MILHHTIQYFWGLNTNMESYAFPLLSYFQDSRLIRRFSMCTYLYHILFFFKTHDRILKATNAWPIIVYYRLQQMYKYQRKFSYISFLNLNIHIIFYALLSNYTLLSLRLRLYKLEIFWKNILPIHHIYCHTIFWKMSKGWKRKCQCQLLILTWNKH